ncbi:kirola-like protein [Tanacetum coccineum]
MSLSGTRVAQVKIKSVGDVFHQLWKSDPHQIPGITPTTIQNCHTHEGELGTVGSMERIALRKHYFVQRFILPGSLKLERAYHELRTLDYPPVDLPTLLVADLADN